MTSRQRAKNGWEVLPVHQAQQQTRAFYDRIAPYYDVLSEWPERPMRQLALAELAAKHGERILEIGCGTGHNLVELAQAVGPVGRVAGVGLSRRMLERAQQLLEHRGPFDRVDLRQNDALRLPYSPDVSLPRPRHQLRRRTADDVQASRAPRLYARPARVGVELTWPPPQPGRAAAPGWLGPRPR